MDSLLTIDLIINDLDYRTALNEYEKRKYIVDTYNIDSNIVDVILDMDKKKYDHYVKWNSKNYDVPEERKIEYMKILGFEKRLIDYIMRIDDNEKIELSNADENDEFLVTIYFGDYLMETSFRGNNLVPFHQNPKLKYTVSNKKVEIVKSKTKSFYNISLQTCYNFIKVPYPNVANRHNNSGIVHSRICLWHNTVNSLLPLCIDDCSEIDKSQKNIWCLTPSSMVIRNSTLIIQCISYTKNLEKSFETMHLYNSNDKIIKTISVPLVDKLFMQTEVGDITVAKIRTIESIHAEQRNKILEKRTNDAI